MVKPERKDVYVLRVNGIDHTFQFTRATAERLGARRVDEAEDFRVFDAPDVPPEPKAYRARNKAAAGENKAGGASKARRTKKHEAGEAETVDE